MCAFDQRALKQRAVHEVREYLIISGYLFVVFSLFVLYRSVILEEYRIPVAMHGFALINALALAKVILLAQDAHLADAFRDSPLIYPTILKSFVFTIILAVFKFAEEFAMGKLHGGSGMEGISEMGAGSWNGGLTLLALLFVVLIPFFGFTELRRVVGGDRLFGAFFRSRRFLDRPPEQASASQTM